MNRFEIALQKGYSIDKEGKVFKNGVALKLRKRTNGYLGFHIRKGKEIKIDCHRFQAYAKYGKLMLSVGIQVRHRDGDPLNNTFDNILIGTQSDNMMDIPKEKRQINASHPKYNHRIIRTDREMGMTYKEIMEKHSILSKGTVSYIINGPHI